MWKEIIETLAEAIRLSTFQPPVDRPLAGGMPSSPA